MSDEGWTIPGFPPDCLYHGPIVIKKGCLPSCVVLRAWDSEVTPWATHVAVLQDGKWSYIQGHYFEQEAFEDAKSDFGTRVEML